MSTYLDRAGRGRRHHHLHRAATAVFFLREADRPVLLLAGGTGLAPILSMLRKMRADGSSRKAHLVYGVSTDDDLVAARRSSTSIAAELPGFTWDHCVVRPGQRRGATRATSPA